MVGKEDNVDLRELWAFLRTSVPVLLLFSAAGFLAAYYATSRQTPVYVSETELVLENARAARTPPDVLAFDPRDDTFVHTHVRILQSPLLVRNAAEVLCAEFGTSAGSDSAAPSPGRAGIGAVVLSGDPAGEAAIRSSGALRDHLQAKDPSALAAEVASGLDVEFVPKTRVLRVAVRSAMPEFAAAAANAMAKAYGDYIAQTFSSAAERMFVLLKRQADEVSRDVRASAEALVKFKESSEIQVLTAGEAGVASTNESVEAVRDRLALTHPDVTALADALMQVEREIAELSQRYRAKHPRMEELAARRSLLKTQIEKRKDAAYEEWRRRHLEAKNAIGMAMLEKSLAASRELYDLVMTKMQEIDFSKNTSEACVRVLKAARVPREPAAPRKGVNSLFGALSGLMAGLLLSFARAHRRLDLAALNMTDRDSPVPLIGRVPHVTRTDDLQELLTGRDATSHVAEAVKTLRTAVEGMLDGAPNRVLLISSPGPCDGKTTVSLALAQSFAKLGRKVLLMDVDLRKGAMHRLLGAENRAGMADYLAGDDSVEEERVGDNLNFMPRGRATDRAAELLATPRLREFLAKASASYDVVVLDSPPVLPVTDASLVARHAGVRLLVMRSQQTHLKAVRAAVRSLDGLGCAIHGAILNGVRSEESGYHGYDGQYRYYGPREARPRRLRLTW